MPTTRYAVVKYISGWEEQHCQTLKIFATKKAAEKYCASLSAKLLYKKFQKGEVIESEWEYEWTSESKKLFFEKLEQRGIFPKENFGVNDVIEVKNLMIDMINYRELKCDRLNYNDNVEEWFKIGSYFVKPLNHF